ATPEALPGRTPAAPDRLAEVDGGDEVVRAEHDPGFLLDDPRRGRPQVAGVVQGVEHVHRVADQLSRLPPLDVGDDLDVELRGRQVFGDPVEAGMAAAGVSAEIE